MGIVGGIGKILKRLRREREQGNAQPVPPPPPELPALDILEMNPVVADIESGDAAIQEYLYFGRWLSVTSSNVAKIRYEVQNKRLVVAFQQHGSQYEYSGVSVEDAYDFARAASKGKWVWDHLRSGGVDYQFIGSADGHVPERLNKQSQKSHERFVEALRKRAGGPRFGKLKTRRKLSDILKRHTKPRKA